MSNLQECLPLLTAAPHYYLTLLDLSIKIANPPLPCYPIPMNQPTIFTQIINGDIPAHKVYEDSNNIVFLDIFPSRPGHMLVVPKKEVDRLEDLPDADYDSLMRVLKKAMKRVDVVFGSEFRPCLKTEGFDVPHAHIHVIPCRDATDFWAKQDRSHEPNHQALAEMAKKLAF